jgi:hypothetical protein
MKYFLCLIVISLLTGCSGNENGINQAQLGSIGTDMAISREMAAKTIALAFYENGELAELETEILFSDVSAENWSYHYIQGCVEKGFFAGSEEGKVINSDLSHDGDVGGGQYLNACVWYEVLFGESCVGNTFRPNYKYNGTSMNMLIDVETLQQAAHQAVTTRNAN